MTPHLQNLDDARLLELLEHPELWPEDPATQAELAGLLELHLALSAHVRHSPLPWRPVGAGAA